MTTGAKVWKDGAWVDNEARTQELVNAPGFNAPGGDGTHFWIDTDGTIRDPAGARFTPVGVNSSGPNWVWAEEVLGRGDDMARFHFNTIRLNCMIRCWTGNPCLNVAPTAAAMIAKLEPIVDEYTALGHVVMLCQHTYGSTTTVNPAPQAALDDMVGWWLPIAAHFADNPRVWFNPVNEPTGGPNGYSPPDRGLADWELVAKTLGDAISSVAPESMLVFDGHNAGQEKGHPSCRANPDFTIKPLDWTASLKRSSDLQTRYGRNRVIMSCHFYNVWAGNGPAGYQAFYPGCIGPPGDEFLHFRDDALWWLGELEAAGIPMVMGEWGGRENDAEEWFMVGGLDAAHMLIEEVAPAANVKPGLLFWHGSGLDLRYLGNVQSTWYEWDDSLASLNRQGRAFYDYCAAVNP